MQQQSGLSALVSGADAALWPDYLAVLARHGLDDSLDLLQAVPARVPNWDAGPVARRSPVSAASEDTATDPDDGFGNLIEIAFMRVPAQAPKIAAQAAALMDGRDLPPELAPELQFNLHSAQLEHIRQRLDACRLADRLDRNEGGILLWLSLTAQDRMILDAELPLIWNPPDLERLAEILLGQGLKRAAERVAEVLAVWPQDLPDDPVERRQRLAFASPGLIMDLQFIGEELQRPESHRALLRHLEATGYLPR